MKKKKFYVVMLLLFVFIGRITYFPGVLAYASEAAVELDSTISSEDKSDTEQKVTVKELDLGDYQSEMKVGEKQLLAVTVLPENATETVVTYSSSNPEVAEINGMGRITALSVGSTKIIASCDGISEKFTLTVVSAETNVRDIDLGDCPSEIEVGTSQLLTVTLIPSDTTDQNISYRSSNPKIVTVNEIGRVTGVAVGKASITVSCGTVKKKFSLKVVKVKEDEEEISVKDIEISDYEDELEVDKTMNLSVTVLPANATESTVAYTSSDTSIATVNSSGEVKGIREGKVTITVTAGNISKHVELTIKYATSKIQMNTTYLVMQEGETYQLTARVLPAKADQAITYESVDKDIVSVTGSGLVTAKQCGSGTVLVKNSDTSTAVMVIVNRSDMEGQTSEDRSIEKKSVEYSNVVYSKDWPLITSDMLHYFYENQKVPTIYGNGYAIQVDGKKISNCENELYTGIEFQEEPSGISFCLNRSKNLCGAVTIQLAEDTVIGKYLYLYNDSKDKYELLNQEDICFLELDSAGKYLITETKIGKNMVNIIIVAIAGITIFAMVVVYIVVKKRYWFW